MSNGGKSKKGRKLRGSLSYLHVSVCLGIISESITPIQHRRYFSESCVSKIFIYSSVTCICF